MNKEKITQRKENKMGTMPIGRLVCTMSVPMMASMLVQALYNIVDSIFVSRISDPTIENLGEQMLGAVSLAFPLQMLMIAVGGGTMVGVNALLSKRLGEKNFEDANKIANNGIFLSLCSTILFVFVGIFFAPAFINMQTDNLVIAKGAIEYLQIVLCGSIGIFGQFIFERLMQSTGKTVLSMTTQGVGAIINIILDPIFIFGVPVLGIPKMGIAGAAIATIAGQIVAAIVGFMLNIKYNREIIVNPFKYRPNLKTIGAIYKIGVPSIIMQSIGSVMNVGMNTILLGFEAIGETAVSVFGAYFKLQSFIFMPVFGLNNGIVPIISYNYGAGKRERMMKTIKVGCIWAVCIMLVGILVMQTIPEGLLGFFDASEKMVEIGVPALRSISLSFIFAGFCITVGSVFQALGNGVYSMIISVARQLCVLLPAAYLLSLTGKLSLVWFAFPIAEIFSVFLSTFFLLRIYNKVIKHVGVTEK